MRSITSSGGRPMWIHVRRVIGKAVGIGVHDEGNQVYPDRRFEDIPDFDEESADFIQFHWRQAFGCNGAAPPRPDKDETVRQHIDRLTRWLFKHNLGALEANELLRAYVAETF